jgi:hypothetical protein
MPRRERAGDPQAMDMDASTPRRNNDRRAHGSRHGPVDVPGRIDAGLGRFLYYVNAGSDTWELLFGLGGNRFTFATEHEALDAARAAARLHWETLHEPSGVYLVSPSAGRQLLDIFGTRR